MSIWLFGMTLVDPTACLKLTHIHLCSSYFIFVNNIFIFSYVSLRWMKCPFGIEAYLLLLCNYRLFIRTRSLSCKTTDFKLALQLSIKNRHSVGSYTTHCLKKTSNIVTICNCYFHGKILYQIFFTVSLM